MKSEPRSYLMRLLWKIWLAFDEVHICAKHWQAKTWKNNGGFLGWGGWECAECEKEMNAFQVKQATERHARHQNILKTLRRK